MRVNGRIRIGLAVILGAAGCLAAGISPAAGTPATTCLDNAVTVAGDTPTIVVHPGDVVAVADDGRSHEVVYTYDSAKDDVSKGIMVCGSGALTALRYDAAPSSVQVHFPRLSRPGFVSHAKLKRQKAAPAFDKFTNVGSVYGSAFRDVMLGNDDDNVMVGNGGDDILIGYKGNDTLVSGSIADTGNHAANVAAALGSKHDQVSGGDGTDTCITADKKPGKCEVFTSTLVP